MNTAGVFLLGSWAGALSLALLWRAARRRWGGITGALTVTLGGEDGDALPSAGIPLQDRSRRVSRLDSEAGDAWRLATLSLTFSRFTTAFPTGPALGTASRDDLATARAFYTEQPSYALGAWFHGKHRQHTNG